MKFTTACAHVETHDRIAIKVEGETATLYIEGGGFFPISDLSKIQVLKLHAEASKALASWPERCAQCDEQATGTTYDHASEDTIPGCARHADPIDEAA